MSKGLRVRISKAAYQRALKRRPDLNNTRVADRLNIDRTLLSHYVAGRRDMPYEQAVRLADWIGIDVPDLIDGDTAMCTACGREMHLVAAA